MSSNNGTSFNLNIFQSSSGSDGESPSDHHADGLAPSASATDGAVPRASAEHKSGPGTWGRRVRFNSDAIKHAFFGSNQPEAERESQLSTVMQGELAHTAGGDSSAENPYRSDEIYSSQSSPTQEDEYLRSFENGTATPGTTTDGSQPAHADATQDPGALKEAESLLRAHMPDIHVSSPAPEGQTTETTPTDDSHIVTVNPRGGLFFHILQGYNNQAQHNNNRKNEKEEKSLSPDGKHSAPSSRPSTPTRRKWYKNSHQSTPSLETVGQLLESSSKLAVQSVKAGVPLDTPPVLKRPTAPRTASGRIKSIMGLKRENDAKITVHVAGILQRQKYILKMCLALMRYGAPSHRLEEYLSTTAKVLTMECQFLYIPGCMIISFDDVLTHTTEVKMVRASQGVNLGKLKDVHLIYKEVLHDIIGLDEALSRLEAILKADNRWPVWLCIIMYGLASTAVSTFFSARLIDMPIIFVLGSLLGVLQLVIAPVSATYNTIFEVSASILLTFLSRAIASVHGGNLFCFSALTQSSIAMILPGWLVLSSALELHSKAIVPGSIRMVYAIIYSLFLGYGITVGTALYGAVDSDAVTSTTCQNPLSKYWAFLLVPCYIFFLLFTVQAKWKQMPVMILIALAGYAVNFYTSQKFAASAPIAYTFGAFVVGILANLYSRVRHDVAAAILLPAVYVQVPGSLASSGAITVGLKTATLLTQTNGTSDSTTDNTQLNALAFNFAASMIQIAIGITVGLFGSALLIYPLGKRRSGLWTL
ncbi:hypothetical protein G7054_g2920 [Neopestalotiopsis clavispora]|nr:hypothetical protein G7054_g2920 [Neopestalotiopsis clavispora]